MMVRNGPRQISTITLACLGVILQIATGELRAAISPGATREEVIATFGRPTGESKLGTKEILKYPHGEVALENGRVVRVEFSKKDPLPTPRPPAASAATATSAAWPAGRWLTDFAAASQEASRRNVPILTLFMGPDGSEAGRLFLEEVALHPEFTGMFSADYVLLRIDSPTATAPAGKPQGQNDQLRVRHGVAEFPTVLFLSPQGERLAAVEFARSPPDASRRPEAIAALREVRARLALGAGSPVPPSSEAKGPATTSPLQMDRLSPFALKVGLRSAQAMIVAGVVSGIVIAFLIGWLMWRTRAKPPSYRGPILAARISDAASGVPTLPEVLAWSKEQICVIAAVLAESEGYEVEKMTGGGDSDLLLTRRGEIQASAVVCCSPGRAGTVTAKNVRDLHGTVISAGVRTGWFVSPAGFSNEARAYAAEHKLLLIDGAHLMVRLHDLPPILLPKLHSNRPW